MTRRIRYCLVGLGNIGRNLLDILVHRQEAIRRDYGLRFDLVAAVDSTGAALDAAGLDVARVRDLKLGRAGVSGYAGQGRVGMTAMDTVAESAAELLVDASPTNLRDGEPGLSCQRLALQSGWHVVTANKGPLVLAYEELTTMAARAGLKLLFSGTVGGGLPAVNIGVRDLAGSDVLRVEGILNGTTNYMLTRMLEEGISYEDALRGAQDAGIAEADPTLDVDGWDAANKLAIVANSVLRRKTTLDDVQVEGIRGVSQGDLREARRNGRVIKPLAVADKRGEDYALHVAPTALPEEHILARTGMWDMGVVYHTDHMGVISAVIEEKGPMPTSAAVLRDMIDVFAGG